MLQDSVKHIEEFSWGVNPNNLFPLSNECSTVALTELPVEKLSEKPQSLDFVFLLFMVCFIFTAQIIGKKWKMLTTMFDEFKYMNGRQHFFFTEIGNELYSKLLLCLQTCIITSIFIYYWYSRQLEIPIESLTRTTLTVAVFCLLFLLYLCYKWISYNFIGKIFFTRETLSQWMDTFIYLICLLGIVLFFPVLIMFYIDSLALYCFYFIIFCLIIAGIVIFYKTYILFFHTRSLLLYLFLYLCAQEMVPLFFLHKGLVYLFNVVERSALWL